MLSRPINVVVDSHIPYLEGVLEPLGDVRVLAPEKITAEAVADADILLIRTRTKVGQALLGDNPRCSFAGTCTIGLDHIDAAYCREHGITAVNAPGCNAPAVAQYVFSAIARLINRPVDQYVLGIVGVGNIGKLVQKWAEGLGMRVMLCDPPRQRAEGGDGWCSLDDIAREADIVTFHTIINQEYGLNTHRIISIQEENGIRSFATKGDNNEIADTRMITEGDIVGLFQFRLPGFGSVRGRAESHSSANSISRITGMNQRIPLKT